MPFTGFGPGNEWQTERELELACGAFGEESVCCDHSFINVVGWTLSRMTNVQVSTMGRAAANAV